MRPGQLQPNEFERAILRSFVSLLPSLLPRIDSLHVPSREYTGVGSFTRFHHDDSEAAAVEQELGLDHAEIHVPTVPSGLGAVLFCRGDQPMCLELFTYGDELWDGVYDGFSITQPSNQI
jgi:hypothetical protein